ncbi:hypothetical protein FGO68_gene12201 [Halteria grandinella]|uniref:Uncharacterized protein n=1 Tax=Halteria grandinella TaxID=5974 RepID=A0A8J8NCB7_HALGN|nr:hypothetical protein FGO68_gene12201 [Halteria grandinella]
MLTQMQGYEQKINLSQQHAIENAVKDKQKVKKYEDEITKMQQEYDQFREKDAKVLDQKIKEEIEFSILRISEKRYEAEAKVEILSEALGEKSKLVAELQKQIEQLMAENGQLKSKVEMYEAAGAAPPKAGNSTSPIRAAKQMDVSNRTKANEYDYGNDLEVRDDLSDLRSQIPVGQQPYKPQQMPSISDEDAFWYGADQKQSPVNLGGAQQSIFAQNQKGGSKLPNQVQLKRAAQGQDRVDEDMNFYGVSVKTTNNKATFSQNPKR